jgi:DNA modification methylase
MTNYELRHGDALQLLTQMPSELIQCCVTSPPYWGLRDYGVEGQLGCEKTPDEYVAKLVAIFSEIRRVLRKDGTLWLNLGDSYANSGTGGNGATGGRDKSTLQSSMPPVGTTPVKRSIPSGMKSKDMVGIPWMVAFALRADGWYLRSDIVWHKPNVMPENVNDRPTKAHEYLFLLAKSKHYFYDCIAVKEDAVSDHRSGNGFKRDARLSYKDKNGARGNDKQWTGVGGKRNRRTVWSIPTQPYKGAHFATFPEKLVEPCILAGSKVEDTVLDPFSGSGTTGVVSMRHGRNFIGLELNPEYIKLAHERIDKEISAATQY